MPRKRPRGPSTRVAAPTASSMLACRPVCSRCFSTSQGMRMQVPRNVPMPEASPCICSQPCVRSHLTSSQGVTLPNRPMLVCDLAGSDTTC